MQHNAAFHLGVHFSSKYLNGNGYFDFWFMVTPIVGVFYCSMLCCTLLYIHSSVAIILMGKRELVALLSLSSWCLVMVVWLFLALPWVYLRFVIVVFPDHTHSLILICLFFCFVCSSDDKWASA